MLPQDKAKREAPTLIANLEKKKNVEWVSGQLINSRNACLKGLMSLKPDKCISEINGYL